MHLILFILFFLPSLFHPQPGKLTLNLAGESVMPGATVCLDVRAAGFQEIIGLQYTLRWDSAVLEFAGVKDFHLPYLSEENFGRHRSGEGLLTFVWLDQSLKGITLTDNSSLYQVCFDVKGRSGSQSSLSFSERPTAFEVVNAAEELLVLEGVGGSVVVK